MKKEKSVRFLLIASFGFALSLFLQLEISVLLTFFLFFLAGSAYIAVKMPIKKPLLSLDNKRVLSVASFITFSLGLFFYFRWLHSQGLRKIIGQSKLPFDIILLFTSICFSLLAFVSIFYAISRISEILDRLHEKYFFACNVSFGFLASFLTVMLSQVMSDAPVMITNILGLLMGVLIVFVLFLLLYGISGMIRSSVILSTTVFMIFSTVNGYVYLFRERLLDPMDIFSINTAIDVLDNFNLFPIPLTIVVSWIFYIIYCIIFCLNIKYKLKLTLKKRAVLLSSCLLSALLLFIYTPTVKVAQWRNEGAIYNGYFLNFMASIQNVHVKPPSSYSVKRVTELTDKYTQNTESESDTKDKPHIIVIMDEAFSDLSVINQFSTNIEVMPFISSLKENTISGFALSSVFGGNTSSSEYEYLTGNTMAWLPINSVPYLQYVKPSTYSTVSYLQSRYNYQCIGFHPASPANWNRIEAYRNLGFDRSLFLDYFSDGKLMRHHMSDQSMFEKMVETFEKEHDSPLFFFGVTIQNHSPYDIKWDNHTVSLSGYPDDYPLTEQYLTLIHETDKAVEYLVNYFSQVDEKVVIVFFGDHQPRIEDEFYTKVCGYTPDSLDHKMIKYKVRFFIWSNYDIPEKVVDCTSLNYLSSYMYEAAGLELPPYNRFLSEMEKNIPSINVYGFYSNSAGRYLSFDEASDEESLWLNQYQILQYNTIFDSENRSKRMFPTIHQPDQ